MLPAGVPDITTKCHCNIIPRHTMNTGTLLHILRAVGLVVTLTYLDLYGLLKPCETTVGELPHGMS